MPISSSDDTVFGLFVILFEKGCDGNSFKALTRQSKRCFQATHEITLG